MADIVLHYFPARGRAQTMRLMFSYAGTPYTNRTVTGQQWASLKPDDSSWEFNQLPVLEIDGHRLAQQSATNSYVARKLGFWSEDPYQLYLIQSIQGFKQDILRGRGRVAFAPDAAEALPKWENQTVETVLTKIERRLVANNGGDGYLVGNGVTLADFQAFTIVHDYFYDGDKKERFEVKFDEHAPKLKAWINRMLSNEGFRNHIETRGDRFMQAK